MLKFSIHAQCPAKVYYANGEEISRLKTLFHDARLRGFPSFKLHRGCFRGGEKKLATQNCTEKSFNSVTSRRLLVWTWAVLFTSGLCTVSISHFSLGPLVQFLSLVFLVWIISTRNDAPLWIQPTQMFGATFHEVGYESGEVKQGKTHSRESVVSHYRRKYDNVEKWMTLNYIWAWDNSYVSGVKGNVCVNGVLQSHG